MIICLFKTGDFLHESEVVAKASDIKNSYSISISLSFQFLTCCSLGMKLIIYSIALMK